jgi:hypothetical protein
MKIHMSRERVCTSYAPVPHLTRKDAEVIVNTNDPGQRKSNPSIDN